MAMNDQEVQELLAKKKKAAEEEFDQLTKLGAQLETRLNEVRVRLTQLQGQYQVLEDLAKEATPPAVVEPVVEPVPNTGSVLGD